MYVHTFTILYAYVVVLILCCWSFVWVFRGCRFTIQHKHRNPKFLFCLCSAQQSYKIFGVFEHIHVHGAYIYQINQHLHVDVFANYKIQNVVNFRWYTDIYLYIYQTKVDCVVLCYCIICIAAGVYFWYVFWMLFATSLAPYIFYLIALCTKRLMNIYTQFSSQYGR